jgi:CHAD domain-containing protein
VNAEREVKLTAPSEFQLPDLHQLGLGTVRLPVQTLSTSYFDTEDLRLWQRRMTLRHRLGEDEGVGSWTLKLPGKETSREVDRTELSWPSGVGETPSEATRLLQGIVRRQTLKRVVVLEAKRRRVLVRHGESALGEIDDDIVTVAGEGGTGRSFRQIEFEFDSDTQETRNDPMVEKMLMTLMKAGAHIDLEQKFAKALGLDTHHRSLPPTKVDRQSTLGTLVRRTLRSDYERLLDFDVYLRLDPHDPPEDAVHQARVATRRLRSDLKTFGPVLDPVWLRHTRSELQWLGSQLGAVRDIDVLNKRLQSPRQIPGGSSGTDELRSRLASQRRANSEELAYALRSDRYLDLLGRLDVGTSFPRFSHSPQSQEATDSGCGPSDPARRALPRLLGPHWKTLRQRVTTAGHRPSDTQLHRIRIASKQLRYGAELAEPVLGKTARRTARGAEDIQTILGDHHDSVTALAWFERVPAEGTAEASFAAGYRAADARRQQSKTRRQWERAWAALRSGSATDWLR